LSIQKAILQYRELFLVCMGLSSAYQRIHRRIAIKEPHLHCEGLTAVRDVPPCLPIPRVYEPVLRALLPEEGEVNDLLTPAYPSVATLLAGLLWVI
jgi:hypothetical protein